MNKMSSAVLSQRGLASWVSLLLGVPGVLYCVLFVALFLLGLVGVTINELPKSTYGAAVIAVLVWIFLGPVIVAAGVIAAVAWWHRWETLERPREMWVLVAVSLLSWLASAVYYTPRD
jgi:hypothetical protein